MNICQELRIVGDLRKKFQALIKLQARKPQCCFNIYNFFQEVMNETMANLGNILVQSSMQAIEQTPLKTPMKTLMHIKVKTSTHKL